MARSVKAPLAAWFACTAALVLLALVAYGIDAAQRLDAELLAKFILRKDSPAGSVAEVLVHFGDPVPLLLMLAIACGIALRRRRPLDALAAVIVVAGANLTTQALKVLLAHPRFQAILSGDQLGAVAFPSGHATAAASISIAFLFVVPPNLRPAVAAAGTCLVTAVGCSAMILGWHYPSDVLGGILVASGWGFAVLAALRIAKKAASRRLPQVSSRAAISVK